MRLTLLALPGLALLAAPLAVAADKPSPAAIEHFEKHVRPVLVERCASCHGPKVARGGLRVTSRAALLKGGDTGPSLVPGRPDKSLLLQAVRHTGELKMPPRPKPPLDQAAVDHLAAWVKAGAPWPDEKETKAISDVALARKSHWSFRPVKRHPAPAVKDAARARTPIDAFLLAKLEAKGLTFAPEADRRTLVRRLSFDLLGLPPTPEEVEAFVSDTRPGAYERLVDRLLASPHYGERWGRHWLDIARYADTKGYVFQEERRYPYAYTYRDYVIAALNDDLPYDTFLLQQLAADQLPLGDDRRPLAAMGFLTLGRRFLNNTHDIIDDRIDVVTRGLMGLTVSCARCHDHKYDAIPTRDYYSLYGVFASSTEPRDLPLLAAPGEGKTLSPFQKELNARQAAVDAYVREQHAATLKNLRARTGEYLLAARDAGRPAGDLNRAFVQRWRQSLAQARREHNPVFAPWLAFAALEGDFAAKAPALARRFASNADPKKPVHPLVAKALAGKPPASLGEVAKRYDAIFTAADKRPAAQRSKDETSLLTALDGPGAPLNIAAADIVPYFDRAQRNRWQALRRRVDQWNATGPGAPARAMVLQDAAQPVTPRVLVRGNPGSPGVSVPRQFLEVLTPGDRKPFAKGSGRLELARAIAAGDNPLTPRVAVNRLWQHHFGKGLVATAGDFGTRGDAPSHPELLDWLAAELVEGNWSLKRLHRGMLLSAAYRQVSDDRPAAAAIDPENVLLWRMNRRRLELEPLRDALLAVSGSLDGRMGGPPVELTTPPYPPRRTVYGFIERQNLPGLFRTFDLASPDTSTAQRHATTVPQQALYLMNNAFVQRQAKALAARPDVAGLKTVEEKVDRLYRLAYGRPPEAAEVALARAFVAGPAGGTIRAWEQYAQVLLLANELAFVD